MEKHEPTVKASKTKRRIDWPELGIQIGVAAVQGAAFALGGIAMNRLSGAKATMPTTDSIADNVIPMTTKKTAHG